MKYLVFDLEKASCKDNEFKVCEFGFVLTNENFKVIDKGNFHINPNISDSNWDYRALKKILHHKRSYYKEQPIFTVFYNEIKDLFNQADFIYGHTTEGDVQGINDECKRYNLPPINYDFYDIKEFYKVLANVKRSVGVTELREILEIKDDNYSEHDAESDAYTTMFELKAMLEKYNITLKEFLDNNPKLKDNTNDFVISSVALRKEEKKRKYIEAITSGEIGDGTNIIGKSTRSLKSNKTLFHQFLDNVQVTKKGKGIFEGKKITISLNYELNHFKQMMNIIQIITNEGGTYVLSSEKADIYVKYDIYDEDGNLHPCGRLRHIEEINNTSIIIITFDQFLSMIGISNDELDSLPLPSLDCLLREDAIINLFTKKKKLKKVEITKKDDVLKELGNKGFSMKLGDMISDDIFEKLDKNVDYK